LEPNSWAKCLETKSSTSHALWLPQNSRKCLWPLTVTGTQSEWSLYSTDSPNQISRKWVETTTCSN
jgi:hypothetical protein